MNYTKYFQTKTRPAQPGNENKFVCCTDDCPEIVRDLIQDIHFKHFDKCFPNDWIYQTVMEAFEALEYDDIDTVKIESDAYCSDLNKWFENPFAAGYCNEILEIGSGFTNIYEIIEMAQYNAKRNIYYTVNDFLQQQEEQKYQESGE